MQTTLVKPTVVSAVQAASYKAVSGRPNGGQCPAGPAMEAREWDSSYHFGLDVRMSTPPRSPSVLGSLPLVGLENPGHSWVFAHLSHIAALGAADRFSECSYIVGSHAALEEDCDAPALADAIESATGRKLDWDMDVNTLYDGLFEWDHAYENFEAGSSQRRGRGYILAPYDAAAAMRIVASRQPTWEAALG